jgi:low affinity Fe/Cu permease
MATRTQSFASHRRWSVLFHFIGFPILFINVIVAIVVAARAPSLLAAWNVVVAIALVITIFLARSFALTVQNRVIRLEERIRLERCLPEELRARIHEIRTEHLIGLRFCSDEELPDMIRAILAGEVRNRKDIKRRVRTWRPDWLRV